MDVDKIECCHNCVCSTFDEGDDFVYCNIFDDYRQHSDCCALFATRSFPEYLRKRTSGKEDKHVH